MMIVTSVEVMRQSDAETIKKGTDSKELMWRAGKGIFESYPFRGKVAILCGSGNNAGDGYVLALHLHKAHIPCTVLLLESRFSEDGGYYYEKCKEIGVEIAFFTPETDLSAYAEIVDCIFGTGFRGAPRGIAAEALRAMNESGRPVISADINSGLCGDNGQGELCVQSALTVSIGFYKYGHYLGKAKDVIGELKNLDIGIDLYGKAAHLLESGDCKAVFGLRKQNSHKGNFGYVSILGGCREYAGAVKLANLSCAALRAGCGVAQLILPESIAPSVAPYLLESTLATLADREGHMLFDSNALDRVLQKQKALAIGMGWGKSEENEKILRHILEHHSLSLIIDADGLNTLSGMDKEILKTTQCKVALTPHMMEFSRLCGESVETICQNPVEIAEKFAGEYGVCLLLKGSTTIVTDGETTYLVDRGCAGMATAGSGDVLAGVLAGLCGYAPVSPLMVACGAYVAGRAGEIAQEKVNPVSMLASDTVAHIGEAVSEILKETEQS